MILPKRLLESRLSDALGTLTYADREGVLGPKKDDLAVVFTILNQMELPLSEVVAIESGASQLDVFGPAEDLSFYDGHISHFFAANLNRNIVTLPQYFASDSAHTRESINRSFKWYDFFSNSQIKHYPVDRNAFRSYLSIISLNGIDEIVQVVNKKIYGGFTPVIFSNDVFGLYIDESNPFWNVPKTIQIHQFNSESMDRLYLEKGFSADLSSLDPVLKAKVQLRHCFNVNAEIEGYKTNNRFWNLIDGELITLAWYNQPK